MYAVGKVGTFFAQSVYTVSGPFHPFGGSVDIIVVQQEDGTYKSSPWYVKFGKFQGVLKRREKKVVVAVNDIDADFHMYLDHKGEAYFLKDAQGEGEVATFSPPEAASSGDENSSHILALEYPRVEVAANPRAEQLGKEESEDDLELRFEGRDASKQLIQQSVGDRATTAASVAGLGGEGITFSQAHFSGGNLEITHSERVEEGLSSDQEASGSQSIVELGHEAQSRNGKVIHALLNTAIGLEANVGLTPASALLANAALSSVVKSLDTDNVALEETSSKPPIKGQRTASRSGLIVHGLLNKAIGRPPTHKSGPATRLIASAALASLEKAVSHWDSLSKNPNPQVRVVELPVDQLDADNNHVETSPGSPIVELEEEVPVVDSTANPNGTASLTTIPESPFVELKKEFTVVDTNSNPYSAVALASNCHISDDVLQTKTAGSVEIPSESEIDDQSDVELPIHSDAIPPSRTTQFLDVRKTLKVRKLEILDETLVVEVQEHVQKETLGSIDGEEAKDVSDAEGRVENIVINRNRVMERVNSLRASPSHNRNLGRFASKDAQTGELAYERNIIPEEVGKLVSVQVDKAFVENLQGALSQNIAADSKANSGKVNDITISGKEVAILNSGKAQDVHSPEILILGEKLPVDSSRDVPSTSSEDVRDSPGKELALQNQLNLSNVSSPRQKAAMELEMSWREVMEKTATTLKGAPYTSKRLNHSQSHKKKSLEGALPEHSEKKSWGGWWWGGSAAPHAKQTSEQDSSKARNDAQGDLGMEHRNPEFGNIELRDPRDVTSELEDVTKRGTHPNNDVEGSGSNGEAEEKGTHSESDSGLPESLKAGTDQSVVKTNPEGPGEPSQRRRSLFGLLARTNANQSSLSSGSSLRSNDDLEAVMHHGLQRITSLERAECVADLLDEKWAKGSEARRARVEGSSMVRAASEPVDGNDSMLSPAEPDRGSRADGSSILETAVSEPEAVLSGGIQDQHSSMSTPNHGILKHGDAQAEEGNGGNQEQGKVTINESDVETIPTSALPLDSGDLPNFSDVDVVLMSVDGHLIRAPLGFGKDDAPLVANDSSNSKRGGSSPQKLVCFAEEPDDRPSLGSPDTHNLVRNESEQETREGMVLQHPEEALKVSGGLVSHDSINSKTGAPGCEGLKGLAKLLEDDDSVEAGHLKMGVFHSPDGKTLATEGAPPDHLGSGPESREATTVNGHDESHAEDPDDKEFEEMRALVFENLDEQHDGDAMETEEGEIQRFYSFKDLTKAEEEQGKRVFRRNLSMYMDALSGEDDQDSAESAHEDDLDQSRDKSGPIKIPVALDSVRKFPSEEDKYILRSASESLPNERLKLVDPEMVSARLAISRSLDSAAPPSLLSPEMRDQSAASTNLILAARPSTGSAAERTPEKVKEDSEQPMGEADKPENQKSTVASSRSNMDNGGKGSETGFELSLCRHLLKDRMGLEAAAQAFNSERVTLEEFKSSGSAISANDKLVVRVGGRYYPWAVAAPIVLGILAFGQVLIAPNEGAIAVEQPIVVIDGKPATAISTAISGGGWKLWPPWGSIRRPKTPERALLSREAMMVATEAALKSSLTQEYLRMTGYYTKPRKVRTNSPSSQQLASLDLKEGSNKIIFTFETPVWGKQQVDARIYLWKWNARVVISDVDGTITKSDVLGQVMPLMGKDWTQIGVARLFSAIKKNGYELMFLSARAISQAYLTRQFLENIKQDGEALPDGPVVISPDGLFPSLYREVIRRAPHEFKIACLEDIKSLFPPESKPFYAGFGNRDTDELSYLKVGIPKGKIFIINPKGEVAVNNQVDVKSYTSLHKLVDDMFPAMSFTEQEDYNEWNFWKIPLPEIEDEPSVNSVGSSSSRKSSKSGRRS